ncbi:DUF418 domain-containing protein [Actinomyces bovis]|uniref:DUF418 domain-containing protein n=1 Tax=Actinomyces bovis TaxID=1658 RepID=UPI000DCFF05D|nr:DUF418 domain-containing protein [Actinomyces bovis]
MGTNRRTRRAGRFQTDAVAKRRFSTRKPAARRSTGRFSSFTGAAAVRFPGPDVARGFMLLLIALANVPVWLTFFHHNPAPDALAEGWVLLRGALVDLRSFPLFAMLFGFGLATMSRRRMDAAVQQTAAALPAGIDGALRAQQLEEARAAALVDSRRLLRRRGWWMLLFGAAHGAVFPGEIIGTYAVIAVLLAGVIAARRWWVMVAVSAGVCLVNLVSFLNLGSFMNTLAGEDGGAGAGGAGVLGQELAGATLSPLYPVLSLEMWAIGTLLAVLVSLAIPATCLGVWLADTELVRRPDTHRRALAVGGVLALTVGALGSVPFDLLVQGRTLAQWLAVPSMAIYSFTGLVGAAGWLALLLAWAGSGAGGPLRGLRWLLAAVGKRSMTVYIGQTVLFALVFGAWLASGVQGVSEVTGALVAVGVWTALALGCAWMERMGFARGPLEVLLRRAVTTSARAR